MPRSNFTENREAEDTDQEGQEVPKYDPEVVKQFVEEYGISENEAIGMAAAEMEGANETETGEIFSTQARCKELKYRETLPEPKEVQEGRNETEGQLRKEFGLSEKENLDTFVTKWIAEQGRKLEKE